MRTRIVLLALACGLAWPTVADAKLSLTFDRASAVPGERVRLAFGTYFTTATATVHVYLVHAPILGDLLRPAVGGGTVRLGPPPTRAGVHKLGQTLSGRRGLTFRVPVVRRGRYAAVLWCSTCRYHYLLAVFQGGIPDDAYVRPTRTLLTVRR